MIPLKRKQRSWIHTATTCSLFKSVDVDLNTASRECVYAKEELSDSDETIATSFDESEAPCAKKSETRA